jgi:uncharacterized protein YggE
MTKVLLASIAALFLAASPSFANITVSGQGKIKFTPNIAAITVTASSDAATAAEAWQKNSEVVQKMFQVLKDLGMDEKDFKTAGVHVNARYDHPKDKAPVLVGYTVSYDLSITARDLKMVGKLLDGLVAAGANRGMQISFGMDNPEELLDQARLAAVLDARKKAEIYVKGAGGSLGPVLTIVEGNLQPYPQFRYEHLASPGAGDSTLQIAAGQQELQVTVTVTYTINNNLGGRS